MTDNPTTPGAWANLLSKLWGRDRFPVDVAMIAQDISSRQPDPIVKVAGATIDGFEGGLFRRTKGWYLLYNEQVSSPGRINFTMAHELGHYLLHRHEREEFRCGTGDLVGRARSYREMEGEADTFSAMLLMPFDDFRAQIGRAPVDLEVLGAMANRYGVSMLAAIRHWIEFTDKRAVMVVSTEGFIDWSWSSTAALRTKNYYRFSRETVPIPAGSIAGSTERLDPNDERRGIEIPARVWFPHEPADMSVREMRIVSDQYDFVITLLILPDRDPWDTDPDDGEGLEDVVDHFARRGQFSY